MPSGRGWRDSDENRLPYNNNPCLLRKTRFAFEHVIDLLQSVHVGPGLVTQQSRPDEKAALVSVACRMIIEPSPSPVLSTTFFSGTFSRFTCRDILLLLPWRPLHLCVRNFFSDSDFIPPRRQGSKFRNRCHFDRRRKIFFRSSQLLGMTASALTS